MEDDVEEEDKARRLTQMVDTFQGALLLSLIHLHYFTINFIHLLIYVSLLGLTITSHATYSLLYITHLT